MYGESVEPLASPVTGQYIVDLQLGDTVEVVVQNLPGNASGTSSPSYFHTNHGHLSIPSACDTNVEHMSHSVEVDA